MTAPDAPQRVELREAVEKLDTLLVQLSTDMPPVQPPAAHWLTDDAGPSYCLSCIRKVVAASNGLEAWPERPTGYSWTRSEADEALADLLDQMGEEIDGGFDTESDSSQSCESCNRTLSYILTDYGVEQELAHFAAHPGFAVFDAEQSYVIDRICLNLTWEGAPPEQVAAAIVIVTDAIRQLAPPSEARS